MTKTYTTRMLYWHWLGEDKKLRYGDRKKVRVGQTLRVEGEPVLCHHGFHASYRALDALQYAPGPIICRVKLGGILKADTDKVVAQERTVLDMADATVTLHKFACWCAERALKTANITDERSWNAINTKLKWLRGEATDAELAAARDAAYVAYAARAAAYVAYVAYVARDAASAAWAAARAEQNTYLESQLKELLAMEPTKRPKLKRATPVPREV